MKACDNGSGGQSCKPGSEEEEEEEEEEAGVCLCLCVCVCVCVFTQVADVSLTCT